MEENREKRERPYCRGRSSSIVDSNGGRRALSLARTRGSGQGQPGRVGPRIPSVRQKEQYQGGNPNPVSKNTLARNTTRHFNLQLPAQNETPTSEGRETISNNNQSP